MMKRKILVSILLLSLIASFAGCRTASRVESNVSDNSNNEIITDTDTANNHTTDSDRNNNKDTDKDTSIDKSELITSEDIKELKSTETDKEEDTNKKKSFTPEPSSIDVGGITLAAEHIPFDSAFEVSDGDDMDAAVFGDTLYILDKKNLRTYTVSDGTVTQENSIKLNNKYERVDADVFGNIYLSDKKFNAAMLNDDGTLTELDLTGKLAMSRVMNFGLSCNGKDIIRKYADGEIEEWLLENIESETETETDTETENTNDETNKSKKDNPRFTKVGDIEFVGNHILVGGSFNDGNDTLRAAVFDYDGNQTALTDNKITGDEIVSMTETGSGLLISTGSNLSLWTPEGTEIGQTKSSENKTLFGTEDSVWINDVFAMDDGTVLVLCSSEVDDEDTAMIYRLSGF